MMIMKIIIIIIITIIIIIIITVIIIIIIIIIITDSNLVHKNLNKPEYKPLLKAYAKHSANSAKSSKTG